MAPFTEENPVAIHGELVAGRSKKVRHALEALIESLQKSTFDVAELLHEVQKQGYYVEYGFESFKDYVESLDIKQRKAQYLTKIVDVMETVGIPRNEYEPVGISKLREITSLDPGDAYHNPDTGVITPMREFIQGLVERGTALELEEIKEHVRTLKGLTDENEMVWLNICVKRTVRDDIIKPALDLAKALIGSTGRDGDGNAIEPSDGAALEVIAVEFSNTSRPVVEEKCE